MSDRDELIAKARGLRASERRGPGIEAEMRTLLPALADLAESEGRRADEAAANAERLLIFGNKQRDAYLGALRNLDAAWAELAAMKGQQP